MDLLTNVYVSPTHQWYRDEEMRRLAAIRERKRKREEEDKGKEPVERSSKNNRASPSFSSVTKIYCSLF